jgi:two-component system sensor histidine kinase/response regulator
MGSISIEQQAGSSWVSKRQGTGSRLAPDTTTATLLIADSDNRTVSSLQRRLKAGGYTVLAASSSQQALRLVDARHPQLLLLGDRLKDAEGLWFCQQIKSDASLGFLPVIFMTVRANHTGEDESDLSPDATLFKPINGDELQGWLRRLLRIKRQVEHPRRTRAMQTTEVNLLKTDIISNVAHELGTPLVQVKAALSLLSEDVSQHGTTDQHKLSLMATQAVARLEGAIENIRQLAQSHHIRLTPVIVEEGVDLAIRHLERSWMSRGAHTRIEKQFEDNLPLVWGDKRALGRPLQLLRDNALKFSPEDSPVYVLAYRLPDDQVWIGVQDFGIGIPTEERALIFEAFYQVDGSSTKRYGGTGTGLALAMLLANGMNTTIELDSTVGEGSTFSFTLPEVDLDEYGNSPSD